MIRLLAVFVNVGIASLESVKDNVGRVYDKLCGVLKRALVYCAKSVSEACDKLACSVFNLHWVVVQSRCRRHVISLLSVLFNVHRVVVQSR